MNKKILVVDDDIDIVEPISLLLQEEGYLVETLTQGEQIHAKISVFNPDLVLLDILMSGSDGRTICKRLKQNPNYKKIPIIMMSAKRDGLKDSVMSGANDFIPKPFETDHLLHLIKTHLKN